METKHTPGEWYYGLYHLEDKDLLKVMIDNGVTGFTIADVSFYPNSVEAEANAKLIAAAPDLLAALIKLRNEVKEVPEMNSRKYDLLGIEVNNAINKATI